MSAFFAFAEADDESKGKLRLRTDRISEEKTDDELRETELERQMPDLFKQETKELIHSLKTKEAEALQQLEHSLFSMPSEADTTVNEIMDHLFTEDYVPPQRSSSANEDQDQSSSLKTGIFVGLISTAIALCGFVYSLFMKYS